MPSMVALIMSERSIFLRLAILLFVFMAFVGAIGGGSSGTIEALLFAWFFVGVVVDFVTAAPTSNNLEFSFREIASLGRLESRLDVGGGEFPTPNK